MNANIYAILDTKQNRPVFIINDQQPTIYDWNDSLKLLTKSEFDKWVKQERIARRKKDGNTHTNTSTQA